MVGEQHLLLPAWPRRILLLRRGAQAVSVAAAVTDAVAAATDGGTAGTFAGLGLSLAGVFLAWRQPAAGLLMTMIGFVLTVAVGWDPTATWTIVVFTVFASTCAGLPAFWAGAVVSTTLFGVMARTQADGVSSVGAVAASISALAAAGIGGGLRAQGRYWTVLEQRSADAVAVREREAERDLAEERLRIARDLHDLVGHEVAALNIHIGVAEVSLPAEAQSSRSALIQARAAVQSVLRETQQILEVLRRGEPGPVVELVMPGIGRVPELVDSFRGIGLVIDAGIEPGAQDVEPAAGLAVYRIVQEALTNAHRHGDGHAQLTIGCADGVLRMTVTNGPGEKARPEGHQGYGLIGMQERVESIHGQLTVTSSAGQFEVVATIPVDGGGPA